MLRVVDDQDRLSKILRISSLNQVLTTHDKLEAALRLGEGEPAVGDA